MNSETMPMESNFMGRGEHPAIKYDVNPYNHKNSIPLCIECHSQVFPDTYNRGSFYDHYTVISCFPCGKSAEECTCKANTNERITHMCGVCGNRPSSLSYGRGIMICSDCSKDWSGIKDAQNKERIKRVLGMEMRENHMSNTHVVDKMWVCTYDVVWYSIFYNRDEFELEVVNLP